MTIALPKRRLLTETRIAYLSHELRMGRAHYYHARSMLGVVNGDPRQQSDWMTQMNRSRADYFRTARKLHAALYDDGKTRISP